MESWQRQLLDASILERQKNWWGWIFFALKWPAKITENIWVNKYGIPSP